VQIWRQVVIAEYRHAEKRREEARELTRQYRAEIARQRAEQAQAARPRV
jgi:hypothetical protein